MKKLTSLLLALFLVGSLALGAMAAESVQAMVDALPTAEEFAAMNKGQQNEAYNQTQQAYDACMALPEGEKARVVGAEEKFEALFVHFNTQIMTVREEDSGKRGSNSAAWAVVAGMMAILLGPEIFKRVKK